MSNLHRLPIVLRDVEVVAIRDLAPRMRRITLGGAELGAFHNAAGAQPAFQSIGPDDHIKIFLPDPETGHLSLPRQGPGRLFWPQDPPAISREYTPRAYRAGAGQLDLDFMLHDHGPAGIWASKVRIGDRIHIAGPKASMLMPEAAAHVLFGDETAIPAMANWIETCPPDQRLHIFACSEDPALQRLVPRQGNAQIQWLPQMPADDAEYGALIDGLGYGDRAFYWGAGERAAVDALRVALKARGFATEICDTCAYWTKGSAADN